MLYWYSKNSAIRINKHRVTALPLLTLKSLNNCYVPKHCMDKDVSFAVFSGLCLWRWQGRNLYLVLGIQSEISSKGIWWCLFLWWHSCLLRIVMMPPPHFTDAPELFSARIDLVIGQLAKNQTASLRRDGGCLVFPSKPDYTGRCKSIPPVSDRLCIII